VNFVKRGNVTFIVLVYSLFLLKLFTYLKPRNINRTNDPEMLPFPDVS